MNINWKALKAVIFDIDGTLYDLDALQRRMMKEIFLFYLRRPWRISDVKILWDFRAMREERAGKEAKNLENIQYEWGAQKSKVSPQKVFRIVQQWIFEKPLNHLSSIRYPGLLKFLDILKQKGIKIAFWSDYPGEKKLEVLGIRPQNCFSATDKEINALKPHPKGLRVVTKSLKVSPQYCLLIGDQDGRDGQAARHLGMPYLLIGSNGNGSKKNYFHGYEELAQKIL